MDALKLDLIEFASIYVIVFWLVIADDPISLGLKVGLFAVCFVVMGGAYCGLKAVFRVARARVNGS
jgi:hypothetical protein